MSEIQAAATAAVGTINAIIRIFEVIIRGKNEKIRTREDAKLKESQFRIQEMQLSMLTEQQHSQEELQNIMDKGGRLSTFELQKMTDGDWRVFNVYTEDPYLLAKVEDKMTAAGIHFAKLDDRIAGDNQSPYGIATKDTSRLSDLIKLDPDVRGVFVTDSEYYNMHTPEQNKAFQKKLNEAQKEDREKRGAEVSEQLNKYSFTDGGEAFNKLASTEGVESYQIPITELCDDNNEIKNAVSVVDNGENLRYFPAVSGKEYNSIDFPRECVSWDKEKGTLTVLADPGRNYTVYNDSFSATLPGSEICKYMDQDKSFSESLMPNSWIDQVQNTHFEKKSQNIYTSEVLTGWFAKEDIHPMDNKNRSTAPVLYKTGPNSFDYVEVPKSSIKEVSNKNGERKWKVDLDLSKEYKTKSGRAINPVDIINSMKSIDENPVPVQEERSI